MEFKDLYLNHAKELELFNLDKEELEMFTMAQIYGADLSKMPYEFIKEKGLYKAIKTFDKINQALENNKDLQNTICSLISEEGELNLYTKEAFDVLSSYFKVGQWTLKEFLSNLEYNENSEILIETSKYLMKSKEYNCDFEDVHGKKYSYYNNNIFEYEGKNFILDTITRNDFFKKGKNPLYNKLFVEWEDIEISDEDQEKLNTWEERMKKYEEVKDMVDHAPEKPIIDYKYCKYIKPTKFYLELKELYKKEILDEKSKND